MRSLNKAINGFRYIGVALTFALLSLLIPLQVSAQTGGKASIRVTPNSAEFTKNSTFSVTVSIDSGIEQVNVAQVDLSYDSTKLRFNEIDSSTSAYSAEVEESGGDGTVTIARFVSPPGTAVSGNKVFSKISFSVLAENTTTDLTLAPSTAIAGASSGNNIWDGNTSLANFQLTAALPGSIPVPPETTEPIVRQDGSDAFSRTSDATLENSSTLQNQNPETPISINTTETTFDTYLVAVKVLDGDKPVPNAQVTIGEQTSITDVSGTAGFIGLDDGAFVVDIQIPEREDLYSSTIFIPDTADLTVVQEFEFDISNKSSWATILLGIGIILLLVGLIFFILWIIKKQSKTSQPKVHLEQNA